MATFYADRLIVLTSGKGVVKMSQNQELSKRRQEIYEMIEKVCEVLVERKPESYDGLSIYRDDEFIISYNEIYGSADCSTMPSEASEYVFIVDPIGERYEYHAGVWEHHLEDLFKLALQREKEKPTTMKFHSRGHLDTVKTKAVTTKAITLNPDERENILRFLYLCDSYLSNEIKGSLERAKHEKIEAMRKSYIYTEMLNKKRENLHVYIELLDVILYFRG